MKKKKITTQMQEDRERERERAWGKGFSHAYPSGKWTTHWAHL